MIRLMFLTQCNIPEGVFRFYLKTILYYKGHFSILNLEGKIDLGDQSEEDYMNFAKVYDSELIDERIKLK